MDTKELGDSLIELRRTLGNLHELDWFHRLGKVVDYKKIEHINLIQSNVDHAMGGLSILYLFAIFEYYFDQKLWKKYIKKDDEKLLRAYRHIRHSIAHGHHGLRVIPKHNVNKEESYAFDEAIEKDLFHPKNSIELDKETNVIRINPTIGVYLRQFMGDIVQYAIAEVAKQELQEKEASFK